MTGLRAVRFSKRVRNILPSGPWNVSNYLGLNSPLTTGGRRGWIDLIEI